ncbi:MAG: hypothetical protein M0R37_12855 [Bacteroidales bacterium]|nr:hypothetical protein [Bacteroidales bacterium]
MSIAKIKASQVPTGTTIVGFMALGWDSASNKLVKFDMETFKGDTGDTGASIEMGVNNDTHYIVWRVVGASTWNNLISMSTITGPQGAAIEVSVQSGYIAYRYIGSADWTNIVALSSLVGPQGPQGNGLTVKDRYNTFSALQAAIMSPADGDAYAVGSSQPYDIYIYGTVSGWVNHGPLSGADGANAYFYMAYATDSSGAGFSLTENVSLPYWAWKSTTTPITSPQASDFTGLWRLRMPDPSLAMTFSQASTKVNIAPGETLAVLFGKIMKWFASFGSFAWISELAFSSLTGKPTTISGYGITDAYTKTEIDSKVSSLYKYKGSVANSAALPSTGLTVGDTYNLLDSGANVAWTGTEWDNLGTVYSEATTSAAGLMSATDKALVDSLTGYNSVTTLASVPITKRVVLATLTTSSTLSLASTLANGREIYIKCLNSSASTITITLPTTSPFESKKPATTTDKSSISLPAGTKCEISILAINSVYYIKTDA